jgi:hypothetical protein
METLRYSKCFPISDFINKVLEILPEATFGEDSDGQIIINTNMKTSIEKIEGQPIEIVVAGPS